MTLLGHLIHLVSIAIDETIETNGKNLNPDYVKALIDLKTAINEVKKYW